MKIVALILTFSLCFSLVGCVFFPPTTGQVKPSPSDDPIESGGNKEDDNNSTNGDGGGEINPDNGGGEIDPDNGGTGDDNGPDNGGGEEMDPNNPGSGSDEQTKQNGYVIYINLDGFGKYYYDVAQSRNLVPTLQSIMGEGAVFTNLKTLSPSITNPCQAMIISGASSSKTGNVYRYYDKTLNLVIQQARENNADTLYTSAIRNGVPSATIMHFPAESVFTTSNMSALYVKTADTVTSDAMARFDQAIKLIKGESFTNGSTVQRLENIPRFISIYCDDLDALGHNESAYYGFSLAKSETERVNNVVTRLAQIDAKLAELIQACKDAGIYDNTTFFLTSDHGMQGFGAETDSILDVLTSDYTKTKWPELKKKLASINSEYVFEYVAQGASPKSTTTVVGVGSGLQMPLTFLKSHTEAQLQAIKTELLKEYYIADVLTRKELAQQGFWMGANVDLLVIPAERYHFHGRDNQNNSYSVRGQHDTISEHATVVYGAIWGAGIKNIGEFDGEYNNTSFGSTIAYMLGIDLLDANAPVIKEIMEADN